MARSTKVKLPPLKVTQCSSNATTRLRKVPRGKSNPLNVVVDSVNDPKKDEQLEFSQSQSTFTYFDPIDCVGQNLSLHSVKERASASAWDKIRSLLRNTVVECSAMPTDQSCILCPEAALYRCLQCETYAYIFA